MRACYTPRRHGCLEQTMFIKQLIFTTSRYAPRSRTVPAGVSNASLCLIDNLSSNPSHDPFEQTAQHPQPVVRRYPFMYS